MKDLCAFTDTIQVIFHTSHCRHEALNDATHWSKDEVTEHAGNEGDGESKKDHDHSSRGQVYENEVEGLTELLVRKSNQQC